jgi:predicted nucleic acid-binding protein
MTLNSIEHGSEVFIDANIFIYHFTGVSIECTNFLSRCEEGSLNGITSVNVMLEVLHRLMMVEAVRKKLVQPPNAVKKLKRYPERIKKLNDYFINTQRIIEMGIEVRPIAQEFIMKSHGIRTGYGLMVNDSIIAAIVQEEGIKALASNDDLFSKIKGLAVYKPTDVNL